MPRPSLLAFAALLAFGCVEPTEPATVQVTTSRGIIEGRAIDELSVFRSIPYAEPPIGFRAQHAIELIYLFQRTGVYPTSLVTGRESDAFAERTMLELWTTFAHTGAPPGGAGWPTFEADTEQYLRLGDGETSVDAALHREACTLFDPVFE